MNNREAHYFLEELQRMMTEHRGIFSEEFVIANGMAIQALERIQSIDAVPVVRCKDCDHWTNDDCPFSWGKAEDAFCSYAERKED